MDAERLKYLEFVGGLGEELGRAFVTALHGEIVEVVDHMTIVAAGKVEAPLRRMQARAAAEVAAMAGAEYVQLARRGGRGMAEAMEFLLEAADLYERLCSDELRREAGDAWRVSEEALAFARAFEGAASAEVKEGPGWQAACGELEERFVSLGRSLDAMMSAETRGAGAGAVAAQAAVG